MDPRMMREWLAAQSQKKQLTEADLQRKRLGIVPNAEVRNKDGESATRASTPRNITEVFTRPQDQKLNPLEDPEASIEDIEKEGEKRQARIRVQRQSLPTVKTGIGINESKVGSDKEKMEDPSGVPSSMDTALTDRATMRGQAGEGGGTTRPNIYNPKINAEDAAVERIAKDVTRGKGPDYAREIDRTRIRMPRGSILDARSIGQMSPEQIQEAMMDGYCAAVSKKKI